MSYYKGIKDKLRNIASGSSLDAIEKSNGNVINSLYSDLVNTTKSEYPYVKTSDIESLVLDAMSTITERLPTQREFNERLSKYQKSDKLLIPSELYNAALTIDDRVANINTVDVFSMQDSSIAPVTLTTSDDDFFARQFEYLNALQSESEIDTKKDISSVNDIISLIDANNWSWELWESLNKYRNGLVVNNTIYKMSVPLDYGSSQVKSGDFIRSFNNLDNSVKQSLIDYAETIIGFKGESTVTDLAKDQADKFARAYIMSNADVTKPVTTKEQQIEQLRRKSRL